MNLKSKTTISCLRGLVLALAVLPCFAVATPQAPSVRNVVVYHEEGRFAGWPANNGIWIWGDEIAVGFTRADFRNDPESHSLHRDRPKVVAIARSRDAGLTWEVENHPELGCPFIDIEAPASKPSPGNINFTHPDFAMRVSGGLFHVSYDRARSWNGPYRLPDFGLEQELTARTDYVVNGERDCHIFISVKAPEVQSGIRDRAFAIRTRDGGRTFQKLGWLTGDDPVLARSVMPATVRTGNHSLVTLLRRRFDLPTEYRNDINFIDAYGSRNDGENWEFLSRVAYTDLTQRNGNPPSVVRLKDGRLAAVYGVRAPAFGIRARLSEDHGRSWGPEIILRDDARTWDIGYCRSVVRADGKIFTTYYYATEAHFENHIAGTIWSPPNS